MLFIKDSVFVEIDALSLFISDFTSELSNTLNPFFFWSIRDKIFCNDESFPMNLPDSDFATGFERSFKISLGSTLS